MMPVLEGAWAAIGRVVGGAATPYVLDLYKKNFTDPDAVRSKFANAVGYGFGQSVDQLKALMVGMSFSFSLAELEVFEDTMKAYNSGAGNAWFLNVLRRFTEEDSFYEFRRKLRVRDKAYINELVDFVVDDQSNQSYFSNFRQTIGEEKLKAIFREVFNYFYDAFISILNKDEAFLEIEASVRETLRALRESDPRTSFPILLGELSIQNVQALDLVELPGSTGQEILLDQLYVPRRVMTEVFDFIENDTLASRILAIEGEAGNGKSSSLWYLYNSLRRRPETHLYLIRAEQLDRLEINTVNLQFLESLQRESIIFLDTVDAILGNELLLSKLVSLLSFVDKSDRLKVVFTSRIQEARALKAMVKSSVGFRSILLTNYDEEEELPAAVEKHTKVYVLQNRSMLTEQTAAVQKILATVSHGRSMAEICLKPLYLRMLYSVYTPFDIPDELSILELYGKFWETRVEGDLRTGSRTAVDDEDLSLPIMRLAIQLLIKKSTSIDLKDLLASELTRKEVEKMVSRGIVTEQGGLVEFYHQTFWEFSLAKAFIKIHDHKSVTLLLGETVREDEQDQGFHFLFPVLESSITILARRYNLELVKKHLLALINSPRTSENLIGLRCYLAVGTEDVELREAVNLLLTTKATTNLVVDFIKFSANAENRANEALFEHLEKIWRRSEGPVGSKIVEKPLREKVNLISLLEKIVRSSPSQVGVFLKKLRIEDFYISFRKNKNEHEPTLALFIHLLEVIYPIYPAYVAGAIENMFISINENKARALMLNVVDSFPIASRRAFLNAILQPQIGIDWGKKGRFELQEVVKPQIGRMIFAAEEKPTLGFRDQLEEISNIENSIVRSFYQYAAALKLRRNAIYRAVMDVFLEGLHNGNLVKGWYYTVIEVNLQEQGEVFEWAYQHVLNCFEPAGKHIKRTYSNGVAEAVLGGQNRNSKEKVYRLFSVEKLSTNWPLVEDFDEELFASIYATGIICGGIDQPTVSEHLDAHKKRVRFWVKVAEGILQSAFQDEKVATIYLTLVQEIHGREDKIASFSTKLFKSNRSVADRVLPRFKNSFLSIIKPLVDSHSGKYRNQGYKLLNTLARCGDSSIPLEFNLLERMKGEDNPPAKNELLKLLRLNVEAYPFADLLKIATTLRYEVQSTEHAVLLFLELIKSRPQLLPDEFYEILFYRFTMSSSSDRLDEVRPILLSVAKENVDRAYSLLKAFYLDESIKSLSDGSRGTVAHKILSTTKKIIGEIDDQLIPGAISFIREVDEVLNRTWVSALFSRPDFKGKYNMQIRKMVRDADLGPEVIKLLRNHLETKHRDVIPEQIDLALDTMLELNKL